jgi:hypothetical protein|tara:strand:- start:5235 stop:5396 length:162 start_codon:yes stop_codon:yes gene_type:complete
LEGAGVEDMVGVVEDIVRRREGGRALGSAGVVGVALSLLLEFSWSKPKIVGMC